MTTERSIYLTWGAATDGFMTVLCRMAVSVASLEEELARPRRHAMHSAYRAKTRRRRRR